MVSADYILHLWLDIVPEHSSAFLQLTLLFSLSETLATPLVTAMLATGRIRNYQIIVGGLQMMNLPISYTCLRCGLPPEAVFIVAIGVSVICELARIYMLRRMINLSVRTFLRKVYINVWIVLATSAVLPFILKWYLDENLISFASCCMLSLICSVLSVCYIGCNKGERLYLKEQINTFIKKIKNDSSH